MKRCESRSLEDTRTIAAEWLAGIAEKYTDTKEATIVGLSGHLGAGKTAFTKAVAAELGVAEEVTSPTFVIMKIYETTNARWPRLVHIDAYRLERREELEALRWEELVADRNNLILVEWPENAGLGKGEFESGLALHLEIADGVHTIAIE